MRTHEEVDPTSVINSLTLPNCVISVSCHLSYSLCSLVFVTDASNDLRFEHFDILELGPFLVKNLLDLDREALAWPQLVGNLTEPLRWIHCSALIAVLVELSCLIFVEYL